MKITIDLELTVDEVTTICQNFTEKEKTADEVKIQVKDTFGTVGLEDLNKGLKDLEDSKEYLERLTWPQMCFHKHMLQELLSNKIISFDEWDKRLNIIVDAWHSWSTDGSKNK